MLTTRTKTPLNPSLSSMTHSSHNIFGLTKFSHRPVSTTDEPAVAIALYLADKRFLPAQVASDPEDASDSVSDSDSHYDD